jgi:C4-dicarboxylate-specific signal transduction histidine kinase
VIDPGQMPAQVVDALIQREKLALVSRLLPGVVHNLSGALQMVRLPLDLMELLLAQGEIAGATRKLDAISSGLSRIGQEIDMLAAKSASQDPSVPLDLTALVRQELDFWRADMYFKHEVTLENQLPERTVLVRCDALDLALAVNVLMGNAVEAMREADTAGPVITVSLHGDQESGRTGLKVADNGPGPDPELGERMFEPFVTSKAQGHDGLGLFLARQALARNDGHITWQPGRDGGFILDLSRP